MKPGSTVAVPVMAQQAVGFGGKGQRADSRRAATAAEVCARIAAPEWELEGYTPLPRPALQVIAQRMRFEDRPGPWQLQLEHATAGRHLFHVTGRGAVSVYWRYGILQVAGDGSVPVFQLPVVGAHSRAGASSWATLLHGVEATTWPASPTLVVARATLDGIEAAKSLTQHAGAVLLVPDAPRKVSADVERAVRVLSGAAPIIRAPWMAALSTSDPALDTPAVTKAGAKVASILQERWRTT